MIKGPNLSLLVFTKFQEVILVQCFLSLKSLASPLLIVYHWDSLILYWQVSLELHAFTRTCHFLHRETLLNTTGKFDCRRIDGCLCKMGLLGVVWKLILIKLIYVIELLSIFLVR